MYQEITPIDELQEYIECIWTDSFSASDNAIVENFFPDGSIELIFNIKGGYYRQQESQFKNINYSHIIGYKTQYGKVIIPKEIKVIGVRLKHWFLNNIMQFKAYKLVDSTISLTDAFGDKCKELESAIKSTNHIDTQIDLVQQYLLSLINEQHIDISFKKYLQTPKLSFGLCSVENIAHTSNTGYKKLERDFLKHIGVTPKKYLKVQRFNHAIAKQRFNKSLTSLCYDCGYYDQNHFIKDVKSFTGQTPKAFFQTKSILKNTIQDILVKKHSV